MKIQSFLIGLSFTVLLLACREEQQKKTDKYVALTSTASAIYCGAFCDPPTVTYVLPQDACNLSSQNVLNCFAWSNFLALNWPASNTRGVPDTTLTGSSYGEPGNYNLTVWESYLSLENVFTDHDPAPWLDKSGGKLSQIKHFKKLNKVGDILHNFDKRLLKASDSQLDEVFQAHGTWLTDQGGNLVWYEVKINMDEYDFIKQNSLYDPNKLASYAVKNKGVWLPTGSMELKASWKIVPAQDLEKVKPYYKISEAMVPEVIGFDENNQPILGNYSQQYVALVGLHIIRKTPLAPQFIWMTFEHIYNAPTENQVDSTIEYSFYNKASKAIPNVSPTPNKDSLDTPVQVERIANNALTDEIKKLNKQVQDLIRQSNPNSVWQYYQLVNVQWPQNPVQDNNNNSKVPLQMGGITPSNIANTTMETYAQTTQCMSCHQYGNVNGTSFPTDYSFVFLQAKQQKSFGSKNSDSLKSFIKN